MRKFTLFAPRSFESKLYDEKQFYPAFISDLKQASSSILIESPFICYRRAGALMPEFIRALDRGVTITLNTRYPGEHDSSMKSQAEAILHSFENMGIRIQYTRKLHRKVAMIDKAVLWEGSLNILSQSDSREVMRRVFSRSHCRAMKQFLSVK